jgi:hypothetical protein
MGSLLPYLSECRRILCLSAKRREGMTYGALAAALGLKSPRQQWNTVLDPLAETEVKKTGADLARCGKSMEQQHQRCVFGACNHYVKN